MKNIDKLADLIRPDSPEAVLEEAEIVLKMISYNMDDSPVSVVFKTVVDLFRGDFPDIVPVIQNIMICSIRRTHFWQW